MKTGLFPRLLAGAAYALVARSIFYRIGLDLGSEYILRVYSNVKYFVLPTLFFVGLVIISGSLFLKLPALSSVGSCFCFPQTVYRMIDFFLFAFRNRSWGFAWVYAVFGVFELMLTVYFGLVFAIGHAPFTAWKSGRKAGITAGLILLLCWLVSVSNGNSLDLEMVQRICLLAVGAVAAGVSYDKRILELRLLAMGKITYASFDKRMRELRPLSGPGKKIGRPLEIFGWFLAAGGIVSIIAQGIYLIYFAGHYVSEDYFILNLAAATSIAIVGILLGAAGRYLRAADPDEEIRRDFARFSGGILIFVFGGIGSLFSLISPSLSEDDIRDYTEWAHMIDEEEKRQ